MRQGHRDLTFHDVRRHAVPTAIGVSRLVVPSAIVPSRSGLLPVMNGAGSYQLFFLCEASYGNVKTLELLEGQAREVLVITP